VTQNDYPAFKAALVRLGRVMSHPTSEDVVQDYFSDLQEFPLENVGLALDHVRKTSKFWPKPSVIREACLLVPGVTHITGVPSWVDPVAEKYFCGTCDDTGFVRGLSCAGDGTCHIGHCGQMAGRVFEHTYTRRCGCVATNPVLMRERDLQRQRMAPTQDRS
jgi:hypothetical protein